MITYECSSLFDIAQDMSVIDCAIFGFGFMNLFLKKYLFACDTTHIFTKSISNGIMYTFFGKFFSKYIPRKYIIIGLLLSSMITFASSDKFLSYIKDKCNITK